MTFDQSRSGSVVPVLPSGLCQGLLRCNSGRPKVQFTRDGRYALLGIWDNDGVVVIHGANTLEEIKRIPMKKPSAKCNVDSKITLSAGISH